MKNTEWGAVAYLSHSKYGLGKTEVKINNYSNTGCGSSSVTSVTGGCPVPYDSATGMLSSTTGNVYGVYDMSGGSWEYVMGNMVDSNGNFYPNNAGTFSNLGTKYYDDYSYNALDEETGRGKLGDATKETLGWYKDDSYFPYYVYPWFIRGGDSDSNTKAGVFAFKYSDGGKSNITASRSVLTRK